MVRSQSVNSSTLAKIVLQELEPALRMVVLMVGIVNIDSLPLAAWLDSVMLLAQLR
jgi:hypothetical protein